MNNSSGSDTESTIDYTPPPPPPFPRKRKRTSKRARVGGKRAERVKDGRSAKNGKHAPELKRPRIVNVDERIRTLDDLIKLGEQKVLIGDKHAYDAYALRHMLGALRKLNNMIGMHAVKSQMVNMILFNLAGIDDSKNNYHTVIEGQPGVGKTMLGHILAEIYFYLGYTKSTNVVFARRADMIGKYLGQTAPKTQQIIDSALGGVLFLDEVYELGDTEGRDMFGKECINVINRNLSEHAGEFVCIVAGYREQIESCFFAHNSGLERRFPYRFTIEPYTPAEMCEIFRVIVEREGWKIDGGGGGVLPPSTSPSTSFFTANQQYFKFMGGDIEVFFQKCKIAHVSRIFGIHGAPVRILNAEDIDAGMELFKSNPNVSNRNNHDNDALSSMYM